MPGRINGFVKRVLFTWCFGGGKWEVLDLIYFYVFRCWSCGSGGGCIC